MDRRTLLLSVAMSFGAGCSGFDQREHRSPQNNTETLTAVPGTPTQGDCKTAPLPQPTQEQVAKTPLEPKKYPRRPKNWQEGKIKAYVSNYEKAFAWNQVLANESPIPHNITSLELTDFYSVFSQIKAGYKGSFSYTLNYNDSETETDETSAGTGHYPVESTLFITERFLLRSQGTDLSNAVVCECYDS